MNNAIITVGKPKAAYIADGLSFYAGRLKPWGGCELIAAKGVRAGKSTPASQVKAAEGRNLLARIAEKDAVWALDQNGQAWSSVTWAKRLNQIRERGTTRLVLVVGGALGLSPEVLKRAESSVSLGPATMAHEVAALVAAEQLYRAYTIIAGTPYHRA